MVVDFTSGYGHGAGDRLRRLTYFMAIARHLGDTTLVVRELVSPSCPCDLSDMIRVEGMDIRRWTDSDGDEQWVLDPPYAFPDDGAASRNSRPGIALSDPQFVAAWRDAYRTLRPSAGVAAMLEQVPVTSACLGVHVRRTDKVNVRPNDFAVSPRELARNDRNLRVLIERKCREHGHASVYLAADNAASLTEWRGTLSALGLDVMSHAATYDERALRHTTAEDFFVDLFALSRCGTLGGSVQSSVSSSAWLMGGIRDITIAFTEHDRGVRRIVRLLKYWDR